MRTYPQLYSQQDNRWADHLLGSSTTATIRLYGCLLTSFAMKLGYYGHEINPDLLNQLFITRSIYINGDLLPGNALANLYPNLSYQQTYNYLNVSADLGLLQRLSGDDSLTITLELDFDHNPNDGIQAHFVELWRVDPDGTIWIYDPWDGLGKKFSDSYGSDPATTIQKFVVYEGTPVLPVPPASPNTVTMSDDQKRAWAFFVAYKNETPANQSANFEGLMRQMVAHDSGYETLANEVTALQGQIYTLQKTSKGVPTTVGNPPIGPDKKTGFFTRIGEVLDSLYS